MKSTLNNMPKTSILLLTGLLACNLSQAQTETPPSRAAVKTETRAASKAHELTPAGEGAAVPTAPAARSTKTRAQRKAETLAAAKAGDLEPAGESDAETAKAIRGLVAAAKYSRTRAAVKTETLQATKDHALTPAGEGPGTASK